VISRKRLERANQIAERTYTQYHYGNFYRYNHDNPNVIHDIFGFRHELVDLKSLGMYRKTRVYRWQTRSKEWYKANWATAWGTKTRQQLRADENLREQIRETGVI